MDCFVRYRPVPLWETVWLKRWKKTCTKLSARRHAWARITKHKSVHLSRKQRKAVTPALVLKLEAVTSEPLQNGPKDNFYYPRFASFSIPIDLARWSVRYGARRSIEATLITCKQSRVDQHSSNITLSLSVFCFFKNRHHHSEWNQIHKAQSENVGERNWNVNMWTHAWTVHIREY